MTPIRLSIATFLDNVENTTKNLFLFTLIKLNINYINLYRTKQKIYIN